jgi:transcriptional regulator with XRE-family HTH domain
MAKPVESLSPLGQHIRRYRRANRYSLKQLSEVAGISKVQLWELETAGSPNPRLSTLIAVARATNTTLARVATLAATQPARTEARPANCRNAIRDAGQAYPKSGCGACGDGGLRGCPYEPQPAGDVGRTNG